MKSMTGYGRAEGSVAGQAVCIEVRSLNHRYKEIRLSLPRGWLALELEAERIIKERLARGRVECQLRPLGGPAGGSEPVLDPRRARLVFEQYREIARLLGLDEEPGLDLVARTEGVLGMAERPANVEQQRADFEILLGAALDELDRMRASEGARLQAELEGLRRGVERLVEELRTDLPGEMVALADRSRERLRALAGEAGIAEERLAQELAVLAERSDVTEEMARLGSHLQEFGALLQRSGPVGREVDFLLQELNREANTLCAKFHSAPVVRRAVALKAELEKIREQVQNVE